MNDKDLNLLINKAREAGYKLGKEFCGVEPNIAFYGEGNHPDIIRAFENAWIKAAKIEIAKEIKNQ